MKKEDVDLLNWLEMSRANCESIAAKKTGEDRVLWLDDLAFYKRAIEIIKKSLEAA